tara:strand:+ start:4811 stop:4969 length:159 start_codon:yes stop_codon:yes gene_type:complete
MYKIKINLTVKEDDSCSELIDLVKTLEDKIIDIDITKLSITKTKEQEDDHNT